MRELFDDWTIKAAGGLFVLLMIVTIFDVFSNILQQHPLAGVLFYTMVPGLFLLGGAVFVLALLRLRE